MIMDDMELKNKDIVKKVVQHCGWSYGVDVHDYIDYDKIVNFLTVCGWLNTTSITVKRLFKEAEQKAIFKDVRCTRLAGEKEINIKVSNFYIYGKDYNGGEVAYSILCIIYKNKRYYAY